MATLYSSTYAVPSTDVRPQATLSLDYSIEGDRCTWVVDTTGKDLTLIRYDSSRAGEYIDVHNPCIVVKCNCDASGTNMLVIDEDGNTLHTFIADHSSAVGYAAFRLVAVDDNRNTVSWKLA